MAERALQAAEDLQGKREMGIQQAICQQALPQIGTQWKLPSEKLNFLFLQDMHLHHATAHKVRLQFLLNDTSTALKPGNSA